MEYFLPCVRWFFAFYFLLFCNAQSGNEMHSLALLAQIRSLALARYVSLFAHQTVLVVCYGANLFALLFLCFAHFFSFTFPLVSLSFSLYLVSFLAVASRLLCQHLALYYALFCMLLVTLSRSLALASSIFSAPHPILPF